MENSSNANASSPEYWLHTQASGVEGPFSLEKMRRLHAAGRVTPGARIATTEGNWEPAENFPIIQSPPAEDPPAAMWAAMLAVVGITICFWFVFGFETAPKGTFNVGLMQTQTLGFHAGLALVIIAAILGRK